MVRNIVTDVFRRCKEAVGPSPKADPYKEEVTRYLNEYLKKHGSHPEADAVLPQMEGTGLDIGCGHSKTKPDAIGVDLTAGTNPGKYGCEEGHISQADVRANGDSLPFKTGSLDYIVARHNLEHYQDVVKTLHEWARVLRKGGTLTLVLPDDTDCDTIHLDPTHKHVFTPKSWRNLVNLLNEFGIERVETCIPHWSFSTVLRRK